MVQGQLSGQKQDLQLLDRKHRRMLTIYGAHLPEADVDRLYIRKSREDDELISVEYCMETEISSLDNYLVSTQKELLMYLKDFEEQKRSKRDQGKEFFMFGMSNSSEVLIKQEEMQHGTS